MKLLINAKKWSEERTSYTAVISNREDDESKKATYFMDVQFVKSCEVPSGTKNLIETKDCFLSAFKGRDGAKPKLIIMSYDLINNYDKEEEPTPITDEGLPF